MKSKLRRTRLINPKIQSLPSSIHSAEAKQVPDTTTNEEENIVKPQNVVTENKVTVTETKERDEDDSRTEPKAEVTSEKDVNLVDTCGASENIKSDVVFKQEQVVPLRSRGELKIIQCVHMYVLRCLEGYKYLQKLLKYSNVSV